MLSAARGQSVKLPASVERLATKAGGTVEITMDKAMLKLASRFLAGQSDETKTRKTMQGLESAVRAELQTGSWMRIARMRSKQSGEYVDVFLNGGANGQLGGAVVMASALKDLPIVHINGTIDPDQLANLGGQFHIPYLAMNEGGPR